MISGAWRRTALAAAGLLVCTACGGKQENRQASSAPRPPTRAPSTLIAGYAPRVPSNRTCHVTVPGIPSSAWPGWDEIATFASKWISHDVDAAGAIHLAEWNDGIVVRSEEGESWKALAPLRLDTIFWAFAVDAKGIPFVSRASYPTGQPTATAPTQVDLYSWNGTGWERLGEPFSSGQLDVYDSIAAGFSALTVDVDGRPILAFNDDTLPTDGMPHPSVRVFRWDPGWTTLGGMFVVAGGGISLAAAPDSRLFAARSWDLRTNDNLGCHDSGAHVLSRASSDWTDLGELKLDDRISDVNGCALSSFDGYALIADAGGVLVAFSEDRKLHLVRRSGTAFVPSPESDGLDAVAPGDRAAYDLSLLRAADGDLWLLWIDGDSLSNPSYVLARRHGGAWTRVAELPGAGAYYRTSLVCVDETGNPVVAVTDSDGGRLLYRR
jgi:hypothetical protein